MRLADTSVWIHALRPAGSVGIQTRLRPLITRGDVAVTHWILLELMTGIRATERADNLLRWFAAVPSLPFDPAWWSVAWDIAARLRRRGISVTAADCLIATVAVQHRVPLVHCDADFERMRPTLPLETVDWTEYVAP